MSSTQEQAQRWPKHRRPWPLWKKIVAYAVLAALAAFSIWSIDRGVMGG